MTGSLTSVLGFGGAEGVGDFSGSRADVRGRQGLDCRDGGMTGKRGRRGTKHKQFGEGVDLCEERELQSQREDDVSSRD